MHRIENLLKRTMGLDAASIGPTLISQTVRLRMQDHGLKKLEDYAKYLQETPAELSALVEAVVVKETWFFRDKEPFSALVRLVLSEWLPANTVESGEWRVDSSGSQLSTANSQRVLRLLSIPCSTGEEPYSMAMALLDGGLPADRFQIDAVDISSHALASAQSAVYRKNSFRGLPGEKQKAEIGKQKSFQLSAVPPWNKTVASSGGGSAGIPRGEPISGFQQRYFQPHEDGFLLNQTVRDQVRFHKGNVLDGESEYWLSPPYLPLSEKPSREGGCEAGGRGPVSNGGFGGGSGRENVLAGSEVYDFIFCRNLLIYFDRPTQGKVLQKLERLLKKSGVLFVGPVELPLVMQWSNGEMEKWRAGSQHPNTPTLRHSNPPGFASAGIPMAAACRKAEVRSQNSEVRGPTSDHRTTGPPDHRTVVRSPVVSGLRRPFTVSQAAGEQRRKGARERPRPAASGPDSALQEAARLALWHEAENHPGGVLAYATGLADAGRLAEAARICEKLVDSSELRVDSKNNEPSTINHQLTNSQLAQAYYLLGLVRDAEGNDALRAGSTKLAYELEAQAVEYYRKALYLEPNHYDTLVQMATLSGKKGDTNGARLLHKRAQRLLAQWSKV